MAFTMILFYEVEEKNCFVNTCDWDNDGGERSDHFAAVDPLVVGCNDLPYGSR